MSGVEIWGALAGIVSVVQVAVQANEKYGKKAQKEAVKKIAREAAKFDEEVIAHIVEVVSDSIGKWEEVVDPSQGREEQRYAETLELVRKTLDRMLHITKKMRYASKDHSTDRTLELRAWQEQLDRSVGYLQTFLSNLERQIQPMQQPNSDNLTIPMRRFETRRSSDGSTTLNHPRTNSIRSMQTSISGQTQVENGSAVSQTVRFMRDPKGTLRAVQKEDIKSLESSFDVVCDDGIAYRSLVSTALVLGCRYRHRSVIQLCLDRKTADMNMVDDFQLGVLHNVIGTSDVPEETQRLIKELLKLLLKNGADPAMPDATDEKRRPLHRAAMTRNYAAVKLLLEKKHDMINELDGENKTALWHAYRQPNQEPRLVKHLATEGGKGANEEEIDVKGDKMKMLKKALNGGQKKFQESQR